MTFDKLVFNWTSYLYHLLKTKALTSQINYEVLEFINWANLGSLINTYFGGK